MRLHMGLCILGYATTFVSLALAVGAAVSARDPPAARALHRGGGQQWSALWGVEERVPCQPVLPDARWVRATITSVHIKQANKATDPAHADHIRAAEDARAPPLGLANSICPRMARSRSFFSTHDRCLAAACARMAPRFSPCRARNEAIGTACRDK